MACGLVVIAFRNLRFPFYNVRREQRARHRRTLKLLTRS
jgi:hypothetical protein